MTPDLTQPKAVSHKQKHYTFTIKASKIDQLHQGQKIYILRSHERFCPYSAMRKYLSHFPPHSPSLGAQPLFTFRDGSTLTRHSCLKHLNRFLHKAGYRRQDFNTAFELVLLHEQPTLVCQRTRSSFWVGGKAKPTSHTSTLTTQPKWQLRHLLPHY